MKQFHSQDILAYLRLLLICCVFFATSRLVCAEEADLKSIEVYPPKVQLRSTRHHQKLIVTGFFPGGLVRDVSPIANITSEDPRIVDVDGGQNIRAVSDGKTTLVVRVGSQEALVSVDVAETDKNTPISFHLETLAALSKQSCSSGACHGSPQGKNGFRLSLRAYDPSVDQLSLIREEFGRRANPLGPEESLLLKKPLMQVAHGGGKRLSRMDLNYTVLRDWIAEGCQVDSPTEVTCTKISLYPPSQRVLQFPHWRQSMLVEGHYSDGSIRDITHLASFTVSDPAIAEVGLDGVVAGLSRGQVAVSARYLDKFVSSYLTILKDVEGFVWQDSPTHNYVDQLTNANLKKLQFQTAPLCSDEEFVRRVYLDVIGLLPSLEELRGFITDESPQKRAALIETLLKRDEYALFWALKWSDLLRINRQTLSIPGVYKYHRWLVRAFQSNMPYDQFVTELLTSTGSTFENPAANFFRAADDENDCTETTAQVFLGSRLECAKCHNHPHEKWTQDNYYGLAAFFTRLNRKSTDRTNEQVIWIARRGETTQPRTGQQMKPWLPGAGALDIAEDEDRRLTLANWLSREENPLFSHVEVNRIWSHVMGRGIVEPIDDFRDSNPPSNVQLLDALARDFRMHGFDRQHILRVILNSHTYQRSSGTNAFNESDDKYFSHYLRRRLTAEQLLDAISHLTGVAENFAGVPRGTKATQLPGLNGNSDFLRTFGKPERNTVCQCERSAEMTLSQSLQLLNGDLVGKKIENSQMRFQASLKAGRTLDEIVEEAYLRAYCRHPKEREWATVRQYLVDKENVAEAMQDVYWALINSAEFLFQH